jgi:hypothetical protein
VSRVNFVPFLMDAREDVRDRWMDLIYGTNCFIAKDMESS